MTFLRREIGEGTGCGKTLMKVGNNITFRLHFSRKGLERHTWRQNWRQNPSVVTDPGRVLEAGTEHSTETRRGGDTGREDPRPAERTEMEEKRDTQGEEGEQKRGGQWTGRGSETQREDEDPQEGEKARGEVSEIQREGDRDLGGSKEIRREGSETQKEGKGGPVKGGEAGSRGVQRSRERGTETVTQ